jgi:uncharacterized protein involved in exopolysaccharide biosynthesis
MDGFFNNMSLLRVFLKWKWHLLIIVVVAALIAVFISSPMVIKPRFKSVAVLYPSNIQPYSDESETEQMLQWLNSRDIMDSIINKFNLAQHYGVSPDHEHYYSLMEYYYHRNVRINKTQFESANLEVRDTDPVRARDMVYAIIDFYDKKIQAIHRDKWGEVVESYGRYLNKKQAEIDSALHQHYILRTKYELIDYKTQAQEISRGYLRTIDGNNARLINEEAINRLKDNIQEKGGDFIYYDNMILRLIEQKALIQQEYEMARYHYTKEFTHSNIISHPVVSDKKAYPIRWLIVLYAVVAAVFFSIIVIAIIENSRAIGQHFEEGKKQ